MLDSNNIVARSKQLIESKFPDWDAATLNVFDTYLSRINPLKPESSEVVFTKKEYEDLLGVSEMRPEQLNKCIRKFMGNTVEIELKDDKGKRKGWINYCLFDKTKFDKNDAGEWEVTLRCHPDLKELFFELKESGYQKYRLHYTLKLKSKASKLLYYLLKDNQYKGVWIVELPELRERLGATKKTYESFKDFNKFILQKAEQEINENTDIQFTYEKVMRGRLTRAVKFIIQQPKKSDVPEGQINMFEIPEPEAPDQENQRHKFWSAACDDEFNLNQIRELALLAHPHMDYHIEIHDYDMQLYHYLQKKYVSLANKKDVKKRFGYMKYLVENDC